MTHSRGWNIVIVLLLSTAPLLAQPAPPPAITRPDVEAFLDGLVPVELERDDVAGAVITVVKDGRLLLSKGYGWSDVAARAPVQSDRTLFRVGSISKLFIWTSVMQLVEQGRLELDRDVNSYLDFAIPSTYGTPITLRHLLTHTPGFVDGVKDIAVTDAAQLVPLRQYLSTHIPERIYPPGETPAYSNYGAALAAYIVERVSGQPFDDYVRAHIFAPLGMTRSTFAQPLPLSLAPFASKGYMLASEAARPFENLLPWPAGSLSTTGTDIARFMLAHLQDGAVEGIRILKAETAQLMHRRQFGLLDSMNGMAFGFYEQSREGWRIFGHGGDTNLFHSDLHLVPAAGLGFFISYNSLGRSPVTPRDTIWNKFAARYLPASDPEAGSWAPDGADARLVAGAYLTSRHFGGVLSVANLLSQWRVDANGDGTISASFVKAPSGRLKPMTEVGPMIFQTADGGGRVAFTRNRSGRLVLVSEYPFDVGLRVSAWKSEVPTLLAAAGLAAILSVGAAGWPIGALVRRRRNRRLALSNGALRARWVIRATALLNLVVIGFWVPLFMGLMGADAFFSRIPEALGALSWIAVLGSAAGIIAGWRLARDRAVSLRRRIGEGVVALASGAFAGLLLVWHLAPLTLQY